MGKEHRIFTQIENLPKKGFFKNIHPEKRADLYIIFPDLPLEYSKTFGLKFRDVFIGKDYIESNILELKILKKLLRMESRFGRRFYRKDLIKI